MPEQNALIYTINLLWSHSLREDTSKYLMCGLSAYCPTKLELHNIVIIVTWVALYELPQSDLILQYRLSPKKMVNFKRQLMRYDTTYIIRHSRLPAGNALWVCQNFFFFFFFFFFILPPPRFPDDNFWPPSRTAPEF